MPAAALKTKSTSLAVALGAISGWLSHGIGMICVFYLTPIIIQGLGTAAYGIWSLIATITNYYGLVDFGIGVATSKYFSQYLASGERQKLVGVAKSSLKLYCLLSFVIVLLAVLVGSVLPRVTELASIGRLEFFWTATFLGFNMAFQVLGAVFRSYLKAHKAFAYLNLLGALAHTATAVCIGTVVLSGHGFMTMSCVIASIGFSTLAINISVATFAFAFPWAEIVASQGTEQKKLLKFGGLVIAARMVSKLSQKIGTLGALWFGGPATIAYYSIAETICEKSLAFLVPTRQMVVPVTSSLAAKQEQSAQNRFVVLAPRMFLNLGLGMCVLLAAYGHSFLTLWIGAELADSAWPVLFVLMFGIPLRALGTCQSLLLQGLGEVRAVTKVSLQEGLVLVVTAPILAATLGGIGLAWSVIISIGFAALVLSPVQLAKRCELRYTSLLFHFSLRAFLACLPAIASVLLLELLGPSQSYLSIMVRSSITILCGGTATWAICTDESLRKKIISTFAAKLPNRSKLKLAD
ncbi:MAG: hypothetical protein VXZ82_23625 [Planctomycetota bacterium]|nr:hypothetical protein [Planctomycetota bacterium]